MLDIRNIPGNVVTSSMYDKIWLFYGLPGTWKTTVATGETERTLLGAYEVGYKFIPGVKAINLTNWAALKTVVNQLKNADVKEIYDTFVIDTIGLAYKACINYICARNDVQEIGEIPYGQGYAMAKNEFERVISQIPQLGYGLIMIAHSDELNDEKNGISVKVDIDKRPSSVIKGMADFILYARREPMDGSEDGEQGVYAYSETVNPNIEVKSRARFFPKRVFFTYENIKKALENAVEKQNEFFHTKSSADANFDIYKEPEIDLESLKNDIIHLAEDLLKTNYGSQVESIIHKEMKGVRISEAKEAHIPSLTAVQEQLLNISKKI